MSILIGERTGKHTAETTGEHIFRRPVELARAVLPGLIDETKDASFVTVEDTLTELNVEADEMIRERGKATRRLRRRLAKYAHRLLEITEQEPDLLDTRSISLVAHASDMSGHRELLEETLEQAHRAEISTDTDINLQAIEAALETDKSFAEIMLTLNLTMIPFSEEPITDHVPLSSDYDYLFNASIDRHAAPNREMVMFDADFNVIEPEKVRPLFAEESHKAKEPVSTVDYPTETML